MSDYVITGKKGAGKTLLAVGIARDALAQGKRVATNLDLHLANLCPPRSKATVIRLPDRPTAADLDQIGKGQDGVEEERNGVIILDEASAILNSRQWADKDRTATLEWLIHSRKLGWDTYLIAQGLSQIDKQVRESQLEYHIAVKRTDKWPIPVVTSLTRAFGFPVHFPKVHIGIVKHGMSHDALIIERKWYRAKDLYAAYDTQQLFKPRGAIDAVGTHTLLSAWHLKGRYLPASRWQLFWSWVAAMAAQRPLPPLRPKHRFVSLLQSLPPDQRIKHWHRLRQLGAI
jgi:hypothetical protein